MPLRLAIPLRVGPARVEDAVGPNQCRLSRDEAKHLEMTKYVDCIVLQHQRTLQNEGVGAGQARLDLNEKKPLTFSHRSCGKLLSRYDRMET